MEYVDYIKEQLARQERLKQKFPYEPVEQKKQHLWMHTGIDRYEKPNELLHVILFFVVAGLVIIAALVIAS